MPLVFFFNDTATTEIYTLSLHDALPISDRAFRRCVGTDPDLNCRDRFRWELTKTSFTIYVNGVKYLEWADMPPDKQLPDADRKSTRLNSSHANISYAVFCLKKKKKINLPRVDRIDACDTLRPPPLTVVYLRLINNASNPVTLNYPPLTVPSLQMPFFIYSTN